MKTLIFSDSRMCETYIFERVMECIMS